MSKYTILYKNGKTWNGKCNLLRDIRTHKLEPRCGYDIPVWVSIDNKSLSDGDIIRFVLDVEDNGDNYTRYSTYRILGGGRFMMLVDTVDTPIKPTRKPNPASVTKKQKAFDKAYAEWIEMQADLNQGRRGGLDISIKAYKKWLWEQKKLDSESEVKAVASGRTPGDVLMLRTEETSLDEFVKVDVSHRDVVEVYTNGEIKYVTVKGEDGWIPWRGGECPVPANTKVLVKWKGSRKPHFTDDPQGHQWKQYGSFYDIVAYKLFNEPIETTYTFWLGAFGEID